MQKKAKLFNGKYFFAVAACSIIIFFVYISFSISRESSGNISSNSNVVLAFVTYNDFGNNLYIDNITAGQRLPNDLTVTAINNIKPGTTYLPGNNADTLTPKLNITNLGTVATSDTVMAFLNIWTLGYLDTVEINPGIPSGGTYEVVFDKVAISPGSAVNLQAYIQYEPDTIRTNDTLYQFSNYAAGVSRKVFFQEFTSATSASAATNNLFLNAFLAFNSSNLTAVKYHRGVPPPGTDSMYLANQMQSDSMQMYYNTFQIPSTIVDGKHLVKVPYSIDSNLIKPYNTRIKEGTPVSIQVSDSLLPSGDTILSTININNLYNLSTKDTYTLKLNVIERYKSYIPIPSGWFDSTFIDIFRSAVPGIYGLQIPSAQGKYTYQFKFYIQPGWNSSALYTIAYIQNETNREILNSAKSKDLAIPSFSKPVMSKVLNERFVDYERPFTPNVLFSPDNFADTTFIYTTPFTAQNFESYFLPPGWKIRNPDALITFDKFVGANGPQLGGVSSVIMPFYVYSLEGQIDTLITARIPGVRDIDTIRFDYAYAQYSSSTIDSLKVLISTNGGATYFPNPVFNRGGLGLATAPSTTITFAPSNPNQWRTISIPLAGIVNINQISSQVPSAFNLYQNYPNPFNPATKIKFDLNKTGFVNLKIYDITGREIASLVNMQLIAGQYEYKWDASNFASGIYFYTLKLEDASFSRRMVLVK